MGSILLVAYSLSPRPPCPRTNYPFSLQPQLELLYPGSDSLVQGWNFDNSTPSAGPDSIVQFKQPCLPDSSMAIYWPWGVYQNITGELVQAQYADGWEFIAHGVTALNGTKLALVPMSATYANINNPGGYAVIYQDEEGRLGAVIPPKDNIGLPDPYYPSWQQGKRSSLYHGSSRSCRCRNLTGEVPSSSPLTVVPAKERPCSLYPRPTLELQKSSEHVYPLR